jgi:hypothetical protein
MRAVIIATGYVPPQKQLSPSHIPELLPLLDRPFLQHVIEYLIGLGAEVFDIVLSNEPEKYAALLGDGTRWGCRLTTRLARSPFSPYDILRPVLAQHAGERVLLAHAVLIPAIDTAMIKRQDDVLVCAPGHGLTWTGWTGWACVDAGRLAGVPAGADCAQLEQHLAGSGATHVTTTKHISSSGYPELIAAQRAVLAGCFKGLLFNGQEAELGVWLSRNVSLHPTVRLNPPVYISANCRINPGVCLGPNVSIGANCILDSHCTVTDSTIMSGSYIGEMLELQDCIVDRNLLVNTRIGGAMSISDDFILGCVSCSNVRGVLTAVSSRLVGVLACILLLPLLLVTMLTLKLFRKGPVMVWRRVLQLPAGSDASQWRELRLCSFERDYDAPARYPLLRHFFQRLLPGLFHVAQGRVSIVGLEPRHSEAVLRLCRDWRALYRVSKAGLITEAMVVYGPDPTQDDLYSAEACYVASAGAWYDLKLCCAYLARIFRRERALARSNPCNSIA